MPVTAVPNLDVLRPFADIVHVTPKLAIEWLALNGVNRKLRQADVEKYARDMAAGRWSMTGEAIKFSTAGNLVDGQHRLTGLVKAAVAVDLLVVKNVPDHAQLDMDSGAKRTASDALTLQGESNSALLASTVRLIMLLSTGRLNEGKASQQVSHSEIYGYVTEHPEVREAVATAGTWRSSIDAPPTIIAAAFYLLSDVHQSQSLLFFESLSSRAGLPQGSAILALDSRLRSIRKAGSIPTQRDYLTLFFKAWNHWRKNKAVTSIVLGGLPPEPK